jgi:uncharacterized delta-60 repeat protein
VVLDAPGDEGKSTGLLAAPRGRVIAGGWSLPVGGINLARLTPTGRIEASFGRGGFAASPDFSGADRPGLSADALVRASGGRVVTAGYTTPDVLDPADADVGGQRFAIARYLPTGKVDTSFGPARNGAVITDLPSEEERAYAIALRPGGSLAAGGFATVGPRSAHRSAFALAVYRSDGTPDQTFGAAGQVVTPIPGADHAEIHALLCQSDGKLVAVGVADGIGVAARYLPTGALDPAYGQRGIASFSFRAREDSNPTSAVLVGGKLLIAGGSGGRATRFALAKLTSAGALDPSFGGHGAFVGGPAAAEAGANAVVADPDARAVAAGGYRGHFLLLRVTKRGRPDNSFGRRGFVETAFLNR